MMFNDFDKSTGLVSDNTRLNVRRFKLRLDKKTHSIAEAGHANLGLGYQSWIGLPVILL